MPGEEERKVEGWQSVHSAEEGPSQERQLEWHGRQAEGEA